MTPEELNKYFNEQAGGSHMVDKLRYSEYVHNILCGTAMHVGMLEEKVEWLRDVADTRTRECREAQDKWFTSVTNASHLAATVRAINVQLEDTHRRLSYHELQLKDSFAREEKGVAAAVRETKEKCAEYVRAMAADRQRYALMSPGAFQLELERIARGLLE